MSNIIVNVAHTNQLIGGAYEFFSRTYGSGQTDNGRGHLEIDLCVNYMENMVTQLIIVSIVMMSCFPPRTQSTSLENNNAKCDKQDASAFES